MMDKLNLSQFVRYVMSAGTALVILALVYPSRIVPPVGGWLQAGSFGVMLLVGGGALYAIHRALIHPAISRVIFWLTLTFRRRTRFGGGLRNPFRPTDLEVQLVRNRWKSLPERAELRGSQVHSLYCSAWAVAAIWAWARCYVGPPEHPSWLPWLFGVFLLGAILEDVRLSYTVIVTEVEGVEGLRRGAFE